MNWRILSLIFLTALVLACTTQIDADIRKNYDDALKTFNAFRNTDLNPELKIVDTEWVIEKWGNYDQKDEIFYKAMLLLPANYSFKKAKEHDLSSFVAFTWEGKIYVVKDNFNEETFRRTVYHELEHLYQERFNITSDGTFDGEKAKASTIEGDAKLISRVLARENYTKESLSEVDEKNAYFLLGYAPYLFGYNLAIEVFNRTNDTVSLLERPPTTMEQVIHPEKYFAKEGFERVYLGDNQNRLGELFVLFFLAAHTDDSIAWVAAEGWNGDAYTLNDTGWQWKISFDSEKDAVEFYYAVNNMLKILGNFEDGYYTIEGKYLPQKIKVELDGNYVTLTSHFLEV
ncbi:hypothetical protein [Geoglobus acetivorans]|uniref:IrrE N-terminal-like domain-containing protein n=1 Tax=Geoglobus acetivorans TaxID=565033 RepID=A0ABZ3H341_GEOAI|nr:hypothetical protein [Geoglobus acetivorans]